MEHAFERAPSGRARCRGCGGTIAKGALRLGERLPNPFAEQGELTLWFHPECGALKRPEAFLAALPGAPDPVEDAERLRAEAELGVEHHRLPRIDGAERAPSGRAACRACREPIAKGAWRIRLSFFEEGRFEPSGSVHPACARAYFGTPDVMERIRRFTPDLAPEDGAEIEREVRAAAG